MQMLSIVVFSLLGTAIGSFLNVVGFRYNTGLTFGGRSKCFSCSVELTWVDLIPVASYVFLRGRCRQCKSAISLEYPIVELLTGVVFAAVSVALLHAYAALLFSVAVLVIAHAFLFSVAALLIVIAIYDARHTIIPNGFVYALSALSFVALFVPVLNPLRAVDAFSALPVFAMPSVLDVLAGPILFTPFALIWLLSRGRAMGFGDAKLALGMGWLLGLSAGTAALMLAFWAGALLALARFAIHRARLYRTGRALTMNHEIAFGPFMVVGTIAVLVFGWNVVDLVLLFAFV